MFVPNNETALIAVNAKLVPITVSLTAVEAYDCVSVDDDAATPDLTMHPLESIIIDSGANSVQMEMLIATV